MVNPQLSAMDVYLEELRSLTTERSKLSTRISKVEKVLRGMIELLDTEDQQMEYLEKLDDITPPAGLTDAIYQVLVSDQDRAFLPTEIRDRVKKGYLLNHSNEMASVHTTLKRLAKNNPMVEAVAKDGKTAYRVVRSGEAMLRHILSTDTRPGSAALFGRPSSNDFKPKYGPPNPTNTQRKK